MKKSILFLLITLGMIMGGCGAKPRPKWKHIGLKDNQMKNSNFELVDENNHPYYWTTHNMQAYSKDAKTGKYCVKAYSDTSKNSAIVKQYFRFEKRGFNLRDIQSGLYSIRFGGYQKGSTKADETARISVSFFDKNGKFIGKTLAKEQRLTQEWIKVDEIAPIPPNAHDAQFNFYVTKKNGSFKGPYLDDVFIYVVKKSTLTKAKTQIKQPTAVKATVATTAITTASVVKPKRLTPTPISVKKPSFKVHKVAEIFKDNIYKEIENDYFKKQFPNIDFNNLTSPWQSYQRDHNHIYLRLFHTTGPNVIVMYDINNLNKHKLLPQKVVKQIKESYSYEFKKDFVTVKFYNYKTNELCTVKKFNCNTGKLISKKIFYKPGLRYLQSFKDYDLYQNSSKKWDKEGHIYAFYPVKNGKKKIIIDPKKTFSIAIKDTRLGFRERENGDIVISNGYSAFAILKHQTSKLEIKENLRQHGCYVNSLMFEDKIMCRNTVYDLNTTQKLYSIVNKKGKNLFPSMNTVLYNKHTHQLIYGNWKSIITVNTKDLTVKRFYLPNMPKWYSPVVKKILKDRFVYIYESNDRNTMYFILDLKSGYIEKIAGDKELSDDFKNYPLYPITDKNNPFMITTPVLNEYIDIAKFEIIPFEDKR